MKIGREIRISIALAIALSTWGVSQEKPPSTAPEPSAVGSILLPPADAAPALEAVPDLPDEVPILETEIAEEAEPVDESDAGFEWPRLSLTPPSMPDLSPMLDLSFGLQQNPYFESVNEDSAFFLDASGAFEIIGRSGDDEHQFALLADWGARLLTGVSEEEDEALVLLDAQWSYDPGGVLRAGAGGLYAYERALVDSSALDLEVAVNQLISQQAGMRSFLETDLTPRILARFELGLDAFLFNEEIEDYLGATFGAEAEGVYDQKGSLLRVNYTAFYQLFDQRPARDFAGRTQVVDLEWLTHNYTLLNRHQFYQDGSLGMETRVDFSFRDDNGGGWYDLNRIGISEVVHAKLGELATEFRVGLSTAEYDVREGINGSLLDRSLVTLGVRIDWDNSSRLQPYLDVSLLNQGSNNPDQEFLQATMLIGSLVRF